MSKVVIQKFELERDRWGKNKGKYKCELSLSVEGHDMTFKLPKEVGDQIVKLCGEVLHKEALIISDNIASVFEAITGDKPLSYDDLEHLPFVDGAKL